MLSVGFEVEPTRVSWGRRRPKRRFLGCFVPLGGRAGPDVCDRL